MKRKSDFKFTSKVYSKRGIMSTLLGVISLVSLWLAVFLTYKNGGQAEFRYGSAVFLAFLFTVTGLVLGIMSKMEKDRFYLFSYLGMILNGASMCAISFILYAGAYGL